MPICSDGTFAARMKLLPLFQKFNEDTLSDDDDDPDAPVLRLVK